MKKILWFILFLYSSCLFAFDNEPNGFRGIQWGASISENKEEMVYLKSNGNIDIYIRKNSKMFIGSALLSELNYGYWRDMLLAVYITASDKNGVLFNKQLEKHFGKKPWKGEIGTVLVTRNAATIYSTFLMNEKFKQIDHESEQLMLDFIKKHNLKNAE